MKRTAKKFPNSFPWLREASSDARKSYLENTAKARLQHKGQQPAAPKAAAAAEARRAKMKEVTQAAAAKLREAKAKEEKQRKEGGDAQGSCCGVPSRKVWQEAEATTNSSSGETEEGLQKPHDGEFGASQG